MRSPRYNRIMPIAFRILLLALTGFLAAAFPQARPADAGTVQIRLKRVRPRTAPGSGGWLDLALRVSGERPNSVRVQALVPGSGGGEIVALQRRGGSWRGYLPVPANRRTQSSEVTLIAYVDLARGGMLERAVGRIFMHPGGDGGPPPLPD